MTNTAEFWNRIANRYAKNPVGDIDAYEEKLRRTQALFTDRTELLEIGCGTGTTALKHANHVAHLRATDLSDQMICIAREKAAAEAITNVNFEVADAMHALSSGPVPDVVMAMSLLHLLPDRDHVIATIYDRLKPGGYFVSSTACLAQPGYWFLPLILPVMRLFGLAPSYVGRFTKADLLRKISVTGFEIESHWTPKPRSACFIIARKPG